ncbi:hypothetical protein LP419_40955 [Massilia sp. H-1]|nr:hypothetical protein LP419_40955 [Massilia sp. H-1]
MSLPRQAKPPVASRRAVAATPRIVQARRFAPAFGERRRIAAMDRGGGQRLRCEHGELARVCLARFR